MTEYFGNTWTVNDFVSIKNIDTHFLLSNTFLALIFFLFMTGHYFFTLIFLTKQSQ